MPHTYAHVRECLNVCAQEKWTRRQNCEEATNSWYALLFLVEIIETICRCRLTLQPPNIAYEKIGPHTHHNKQIKYDQTRVYCETIIYRSCILSPALFSLVVVFFLILPSQHLPLARAALNNFFITLLAWCVSPTRPIYFYSVCTVINGIYFRQIELCCRVVTYIVCAAGAEKLCRSLRQWWWCSNCNLT